MRGRRVSGIQWQHRLMGSRAALRHRQYRRQRYPFRQPGAVPVWYRMEHRQLDAVAVYRLHPLLLFPRYRQPLQRTWLLGNPDRQWRMDQQQRPCDTPQSVLCPVGETVRETALRAVYPPPTHRCQQFTYGRAGDEDG